MTETTLWIFESFIGGLCLGAIITMAMWGRDIKDRELVSSHEQSRAYEQGYREGGRLRFRERCEIERRCRELENMIQEEKNDESIQGIQ